jgi:tetratricopeptide (TPR) repeat protein
LKDPKNRLDQQSEEVAQGYYNFANVLCQLKGDLVKAEMLGRESLRIRTRLYGNNHQNVGYISSLLGRILKAQNKLGRETKELFERSLAIDTESFGPDGTNTAVSVVNLANFYGQCADAQKTTETRKEQLLLSRSKFVEAVRIYQKILGPNHPTTIGLSSNVSMISNRLSEMLR